MRPINKKQNKTYIVPIPVFLFGCLILSVILYKAIPHKTSRLEIEKVV